jgi:hypothetical protein
MLDDVPGFTWGLVEAMAKSGVRYLVIGADAWRNNIQDAPLFFYLSGPEGGEILIWRSASNTEGMGLVPEHVDPYFESAVRGINLQDGEGALGPFFEGYEPSNYFFDAILLQAGADFLPPRRACQRWSERGTPNGTTRACACSISRSFSTTQKPTLRIRPRTFAAEFRAARWTFTSRKRTPPGSLAVPRPRFPMRNGVYAATGRRSGARQKPSVRFIAITPENVYLEAFKEAEDADGVIFRLYEEAELHSQVTVRLNLPGRTETGAWLRDAREQNRRTLEWVADSPRLQMTPFETAMGAYF